MFTERVSGWTAGAREGDLRWRWTALNSQPWGSPGLQRPRGMRTKGRGPEPRTHQGGEGSAVRQQPEGLQGLQQGQEQQVLSRDSRSSAGTRAEVLVLTENVVEVENNPTIFFRSTPRPFCTTCPSYSESSRGACRILTRRDVLVSLVYLKVSKPTGAAVGNQGETAAKTRQITPF